MDRGSDPDDGGRAISSSPLSARDSAQMDRNPSPPPDLDGAESGEEGDAIGETVYSKHWLFSTLTRLVQSVTEQEGGDQESQVELSEEEEEELCKIWDMAMDKDVAGFLQEFKAPDILLGVIAKSRSPRLTEICVGILGNMACFPNTCLTLSQNEDLGAVLLLLLGDADPPTLLETCRLLLTCLSQSDVAPLWLERVRQQKSVYPNLCFIMCSSTNTDLLVKVGELVDKLFDLDEDLMKSWITAQPSEVDPDSQIHISTSLLEATKQLRTESLDSLEVYLHAIQLLTTVDEGVQLFLAEGEGLGKEAWNVLKELVCQDLCQMDDPPVILQEQKGLLAPALAVLSTLFPRYGQQGGDVEQNLPLIGSLLRVLQYLQVCQQRETGNHTDSEVSKDEEEEEEDVQLQALKETTAEFLASVLIDLTKGAMAELVKRGSLTAQTCLLVANSLLPQHRAAVDHMTAALSEEEPKLVDVLKGKLPAARP
ncbi:protein saal1 isoform X1 [Paramormyrops kingsleyae]|uniref:Serum amyloid A-like 1 n=1 Tax=Paramormyrops kingsleyae TaxID=1676925 RepID=A0A3B3QA59_9TELE|nr:protein SAAL1 isoform X2 [Paramormyrops kingsleyae]